MIYLSPHSQQLATHQKEEDCKDARETERARLLNEFREELEERADTVFDMLPCSSLRCRLENLLLEAATILADQEITNLEQGKYDDF